MACTCRPVIHSGQPNRGFLTPNDARHRSGCKPRGRNDMTVELRLDASGFVKELRNVRRSLNRVTLRAQILLGLAQVTSACTAAAMVAVTGSWWALLTFAPCALIAPRI